MNKVLSIIVAVAAVLSCAADAFGDPREVKKSGNAKNSTGAQQDRFHVRINSDTNMTVKAALLGNNGKFHPGQVTGNGTNRLTIVWNVIVPNNDTIGWTVRFNQEEKNDWIPTSSGWGDPPSIAGGGPAEATLGLRILPDGSYFLTNGYGEAVVHSAIDYDVFDSDVMPTDEDVVSSLEAGTVPISLAQSLPSGSVPSGSAAHVATVPISEGQFFYAALSARFASDAAADANLILQGHEHQSTSVIPAVSTWGLMVMGLLTIVAGTLILRRHL